MLNLLLVFAIFYVGFSIVLVWRKHRRSYVQGKITRNVFHRNTTLEIFGILLAMGLAGLLGRYLSQAVTLQISHTLTRIVTGILLGVVVGVGVGLLVKRTWGRLVKA